MPFDQKSALSVGFGQQRPIPTLSAAPLDWTCVVLLDHRRRRCRSYGGYDVYDSGGGWACFQELCFGYGSRGIAMDLPVGGCRETAEQVQDVGVGFESVAFGISDDGEVLGLDNDYASLGDADKDKFEMHLRNVITNALGKSFCASRVKIRFPEVQGLEICHMEIQQHHEPLVMPVTDKSGQKSEKFYVRNGNASQEIAMSEMSAYMKERFKS